MREQLSLWILDHINQITHLDTEIILLCILVVICTIVIDALSSAAASKRKSSGADKPAKGVSVDGSEDFPTKQYISDIQGLAGRPDAIIKEGGYYIPIERKPLAKKLHDRYIAQLLVYMRLIEEFEGKRPPYGYLLIGSNCRKIRIDNTEERQLWLQGHLDKMHDILNKKCEAIPEPHPRKCSRCEVRHVCGAALLERAIPHARGNNHHEVVAIRKSGSVK